MWHGGGDEGCLVNVGGPLKRECTEVSHSSASIKFMPIFHYPVSFLTCNNNKKNNTHTHHIHHVLTYVSEIGINPMYKMKYKLTHNMLLADPENNMVTRSGNLFHDSSFLTFSRYSFAW